mmetsp:Transcript_29965/g.82234  ORF Transcript_29965/g.82234 Transcript_29965/m.82234 type:complete len:956 (-) Transcript_29965:1111-3978(-)|eukprot:CAMPEP_0168748324 /NCGR_PEP_ID=MMETSP0724-20121128/16116_1 /TAXON_ID=265536 /ORGANISM="Amphiprora sp., Strain CCMP467" /LENGTH=955 /DNA_ID=CAMNT_0008796147 /DNA_START=207 /DNA_END=3074 /DNA_ORIENTATION=-
MSYPSTGSSSGSTSSQSFLINEVEGTVVSELDEGGVEDFIIKQKEAKRELEAIRQQQKIAGQRYNSDKKKSQITRSTHTMETEDYDDFMGDDGDDEEYNNQARRRSYDDDDESSTPDPGPSPENSSSQEPRATGRGGSSRGRKKKNTPSFHSKQSASSPNIPQRSRKGQDVNLTNGYNAVPWKNDQPSRRQVRRSASGRVVADDVVSQYSGESSMNQSRNSGSSVRRGEDIINNEEEEDEEEPVSQEAVHALQCAAIAAREFDAHFGAIKNPQRENGTPLFHSQELLTAREPIRQSGYYTEYALTAVRLVTETGQFGDLPQTRPSSTSEKQQEARHRFMERSIDGHYSVKYLQAGLIEATDHGGTAAGDMIYETRILMNLTPQHPNITPIYGVNSGGIDTFLETRAPKDGFFFFSDRIVDTLQERMEQWRKGKKAKGRGVIPRMPERMDVAFDIASALLFLNDRNIVYYVRPDKVGFDAKQGIVKLCNFSQARYDGMQEHLSRSITKAADMGTLAYTAPEILCKSPGTTSCDVYGFGIMLWELMSLRQPFAGYDRANHFEFVVQQHKRPPMNKKWSSDIKSLLLGCWDPHLRLSMRKVNESLERILVILNEEQQQNQFENEAAQSGHRSDVMPQRRRKSAGAGREGIPASSSRSKSKRQKDSPQRPEQSSSHEVEAPKLRQPRRFSTGGAQAIDLAIGSKSQSSSPPAEQATRTATQTRPRARRRKSGSAAVTNPNLEREAEPGTPSLSETLAQGADSAARPSLYDDAYDTMSAYVSVGASGNRSAGKHPRRSSLGHTPAHIKRGPLYRRKNDSGHKSSEELYGSSGNTTPRTDPISESVTSPEPELPTTSDTSQSARVGLHQYATQKHVGFSQAPPSETEEDPNADLGELPKSEKKATRSFRDKIASLKDALTGKGGLPRDISFEAPVEEEEKSMLDYVRPAGFSKAKRRASFA